MIIYLDLLFITDHIHFLWLFCLSSSSTDELCKFWTLSCCSVAEGLGLGRRSLSVSQNDWQPAVDLVYIYMGAHLSCCSVAEGLGQGRRSLPVSQNVWQPAGDLVYIYMGAHLTCCSVAEGLGQGRRSLPVSQNDWQPARDLV